MPRLVHVALADARRVPLTVFHNRRWDADQRTLARLLAEGRLGAVQRYESRFERWRPSSADWLNDLSLNRPTSETRPTFAVVAFCAAGAVPPGR